MSIKSKVQCSVAILTLAGLLCGCSAHQDAPATPVMSSATPTYRSSANSYDQPNTPLATQPGVNGGTPAKLTPISTVNRFDQNAALAGQVYSALQNSLGPTNVRYLAVQSKGKTVLLAGTVSSPQIAAQAKQIAIKALGVTTVIDQIKIQ